MMADVENQTLHILREFRAAITTLDDKVDHVLRIPARASKASGRR